MTTVVSVTGTACLHPQLLISRESSSWSILVNAGENTQRFAVESKHLRLVKVTDVLLTEISAATVGGLLGALLTIDMSDTLSDTLSEACLQNGVPVNETVQWKRVDGFTGAEAWLRQPRRALRRLTVWGPPPLLSFLRQSVSAFAPLKHFALMAVEIHSDLSADIPKGREDSVKFHFRCISQQGNKKLKVERQILSILLESPPKPGKMDAAKVNALGPPGSWREALKKGQSVSLPCGRVVQPHEVVGPTVIPPLVGFGHSATLDGDLRLETNRSLLVFWEMGDEKFDTEILLSRFGNKQPQNFCIMASYHAETPFTTSECFVKAINYQTAGILAFPAATVPQSFNDEITSNIIRRSNLLENIRVLDDSQFEGTLPEELPTKTISNEILAEFEKIQFPREGPRITFLGTGSALPSKLRNVSAIFLDYPEINFGKEHLLVFARNFVGLR